MNVGTSRWYTPLHIDEILPRVTLLNPAGESFGMPRWRLNLLVCDDNLLYLVAPGDSSKIISYAIERGGVAPMTLRALNEYVIAEEDVHANNATVFKSKGGSAHILITGGSPGEEGANGKLLAFRIPKSPGAESSRQATVFRLPLKSMWGVDVQGNGSDLVAISSNSHVSALCRLEIPEDHSVGPPPSLTVVHQLRGHVGNIPCVSFGSLGISKSSLVLSASIDSTFCIFDAATGHRLYQDCQVHQPGAYEDETFVKEWCWCLRKLETSSASGAVTTVLPEDPLWGAIETVNPRMTFWLNARELQTGESVTPPLAELDPRNQSDNQASRSVVVPVYEDVQAGLINANMPLPSAQNSTASSIPVGESWHLAKPDEPHVLLGPSATGQDDELMVVGRVETIHLYRLKSRPGAPGMGSQMATEELQSLRPVLRLEDEDSGSEVWAGFGRISQIIQLEALGALLVVQQGGGVSVIRLVSRARQQGCHHGPSKLTSGDEPPICMVVERQLSMDWRPIAGLCVLERKDKYAAALSTYEVFIVQASDAAPATIRCFELHRNEHFRLTSV